MARSAGLFEKYPNSIFVETGTFRGDTVQEALDVGFETVYSVELDLRRYTECEDRFKDNPNVHIFHGDTIDVFPEIMKLVDKRATIWLDSHITRGVFGKHRCSLIGELEILEGHPIKDHSILIDDRRMLGSRRFGRVKEESVREAIKKVNPDYEIIYEDGRGKKLTDVIKDDIIVARIV